MKLHFLKYLLGLLFLSSCTRQQYLELKYNENNESKFVKSYVSNDNNSLYIVTFETDQLKKSEQQYYLYKINLKTKKIENQATLVRDLSANSIIIKEENDSVKIINYSTFNENDNVKSFIFSRNLKTHRFFSLPISDHINKYQLKYFFDSYNNLIYIDSESKKNLSSRHFLDKDTLFLFENNPIEKLIGFSKISSKITYEKKFPYINQIGFESDFREYNKYRFNGDFLFTNNKIYVYPYLDLALSSSFPVDQFNVLVFDKNNGNLIKTQKVHFEKILECENLNILLDYQLNLSTVDGVKLTQFGLDNKENFCLCASKPISSNFSNIKKISVNGNKIFIGNDYKKHTVKIIL